jgi:hypothetical protein
MNDPEKRKSELNKDSDIDAALVKRIIEIQDLPEEVVIRFIKAAGSLSSTNFGKSDPDELS